MESASTRTVPLSALVPLATGLDLEERLVWVRPQAVSESRKGGLRAGKGRQEEKGGKGALNFIWRVWGKIYILNHWGGTLGRPGGGRPCQEKLQFDSQVVIGETSGRRRGLHKKAGREADCGVGECWGCG